MTADLNAAVRFSAADIADKDPEDAFKPDELFVRAEWFEMALTEIEKLRALLLTLLPEDNEQ